jgi:hypothetical protein
MGESKYYVSHIPATEITPEKKMLRPSQAKTVLKDLSRIVGDTASHKRVQLFRAEYWEKVKNLDFKDLVFRMGNGSVTRIDENPCPRRTWRESL